MKKIFSILFASLALASCVDTVILPDDKTVDEDFWKTKSNVTSMVNGAYAAMTNADLNQRLIIWGGLRSDEFNVVTTATNALAQDLKEINSANIQTDNVFGNWATFYSVINYCNIVIKRAPEVMDLDPNYLEGDCKSDIAQMKALRALCYFDLVRAFRDVPLITEPYMESSQDYDVFQTNPKAVIDQVITDLEEAWPDALKSDGNFDETWMTYGYMTKNAIWAILADAYLWRGSVMHSNADYEKCILYCDKIKEARKAAHKSGLGGHFGGNNDENNEYFLNSVDEYYNVFSNNSSASSFRSMNEAVSSIKMSNNPAICQLYYKMSNNSSGNGYLVVSGTYGAVGGSPESAVFLTDKDIRGFESVYAFNTSAEEFQVRKFIAQEGLNGKNTADKRTGTRNYDGFQQDWINYRISDIMLMKAEALVQIDSLEDAVHLVSQVNARALIDANKADSLSWDKYKNSSKDEIELLVLQERARELCFEGKRWFDLLRYNYRHIEGENHYDLMLWEMEEKAIPFSPVNTTVLNLVARKYTSGGAGVTAKIKSEPYLYMPIIQSEMDVNPNLVQNPVYSENNEWQKDM